MMMMMVTMAMVTMIDRPGDCETDDIGCQTDLPRPNVHTRIIFWVFNCVANVNSNTDDNTNTRSIQKIFLREIKRRNIKLQQIMN